MRRMRHLDSALTVIALLITAWSGAVQAQQPSGQSVKDTASASSSSQGSTQREVISKEGTNFAVSPSPDGKSMVIDFHGSLWLLARDGGRAHRLTEWQTEASRPTWSPRGDLIAFQAYINGTFQIWTVRPDGSELTQRTFGLSDDREPAWSLDGRSLAFASDRADAGSFDIWVLDLADGHLERRTTAPTEDSEPAWSPDGSSIAYVENGKGIASIDKKGTRTVLVPEAADPVMAPAWRARGRLAYLATKPDTVAQGLFIRTVEGDVLVSDEDVFPLRPSFPSSSRMLYTANGGIRERDLSTGAVKSIPFEVTETIDSPASKPILRLTSSATARSVYGITTPLPSPDGQTILVGALADLYLVKSDGSFRKLTDDEHWEGSPAWSVDGRAVFYVSGSSGVPTLYRHSIAEEKPVAFGLAIKGLEAAAVSPDESHIAYITKEGVFIRDRANGLDRMLLKSTVRYAYGDQLSWSPDGRMLVLSEKKQINKRFREGVNLIRIVDVVSGKTALFSPAPDKGLTDRGGGIGPVWSPDGKRLAFVMDSRIWTLPVGADGTPAGPAQAVTEDAGDYPAWSRDARRVYYSYRGHIASADLDGGNVRTQPFQLQYAQSIAKGETVIRAGRFWDGIASTYQHDVDIIIRDDRIAAVRPHRPERKRNTVYVDARDRTVMPGLIDMHVHPTWQDARIWRAYLAMGITSIASMGTPLGETVQRREAIAAGRMIAPRLFAAGEPIDGIRINYVGDRAISSDKQLEMELARMTDAKVDFIKTYVRLPGRRMAMVASAADAAGVASGSHYMWPGLASGQTLTTHLSATSRLGYSLTVSPAGISYADVVSAYGIGKLGLIQTTFNRRGIGDDPSLLDDARVRRLLDPGFGDMLREWVKQPNAPASLATAAYTTDAVRRIAEAGGVVALGTDAPLTVPALGLHMDIRLLSKMGLTPVQVLRMATANGPRLLGADQDLGVLTPGKLADLIIVAGDPLDDINSLLSVDKVMVGGHLYNTSDL